MPSKQFKTLLGIGSTFFCCCLPRSRADARKPMRAKRATIPQIGCVLSHSRSALFIRVCQPSPLARNCWSTSAS